MSSPEVTLTVDGQVHRGWQEVSVTLSVERLSGQFDLTLTDAWSEGGKIIRRSIRPGSACALALAGTTVVTGYVDKVAPSYDATSHRLSVSGRDRTGDLVDCSSDRQEFLKLDAGQIAALLCQPFGIPVTSRGDMGKPFGRYAVNIGDTFGRAIEEICRQRGLWAYADGQGGLVLTDRVGGIGPGIVLVKGSNILAGGAELDWTDRFSHYIVKGSQEGADGMPADELAKWVGQASDNAVTRHRPRVTLHELSSEGPGVQPRADHEARVKAGRSARYRYEVQGWTGQSGILRPGQSAHMGAYGDGWTGAASSQTYVISEVTLTRGAGGTTADLTLMHPAAFDKLAEPTAGDSW
jgi:prophage tail gpP-like protein